MKYYIFIGIIILTLILLCFSLRIKYIETLDCLQDPTVIATEEIVSKFENLNKSLIDQYTKIDVVGNAVDNIMGKMNDFKFSIGSIKVTDSGGPSLDISGSIKNPILNFKFIQPPEGDKGFSGKIGMYGPRGRPGKDGAMGLDGYWGSSG
jgi:hypothetical protein